MNFKPRKWHLTAGIVIIILLFLNPSLDQFTDFIGHSKLRQEYHNLVRKDNFLIFSIYADQTLDVDGGIESETKFIGLLNNFISL